MTPRLAASFALLPWLVSCGGNVVVDTESTPETLDASADVVVTDPSVDPLDAGPPTPDAAPVELAPCHCKDDPNHEICVAPLQCCPVAGCKDPAKFSCTGSAQPCP